MSTIQDVTPEELAKLIYHYRAALAHDGNGHGVKGAPPSWDRTPEDERKLMVAAARLTLLELATTPASKPGRRYYAIPGEAEWGC
jgi:hypothetical protein